MHILLIHQAFAAPNQPGGTRHFELARYLVEWGHQVTVVSSDVSYLTGATIHRSERSLWTTTKEAGVEMRWVRTYSQHHRSFVHRSLAFLSFSMGALVGAVRDVHPDIVIGTSPPPLQPLSAYIAAKWHHVPFVFEIRDLFWEYALQTGAVRAGVLVSAARGLEDWLCRRANHLVVNSPGFIPYLHERGNRAERITLVPNSVDAEQFSPAKADRGAWREFGCQDQFIVLYAGAHGMLNDLDTLINAAGFLRSFPEIRVCLIGDGKEKSALVQRTREAGLDNVLFIPPQPKSAMPTFVASADVCVATLRDLPSLRTVYPNKVFDYMAAGRPVILAIDGEIRRVIEAANAGICVPPGDSQELAAAVLHMYHQRSIADTQGANGRSYVIKHFNRVDQARKLESLLQRVILMGAQNRP